MSTFIRGAWGLRGLQADLTFDPGDEALVELRQAWAWLLPDNWTPLVFSVLGDVFLADTSGRVLWLDTGIGRIGEVAPDRERFLASLAGKSREEWLLPTLVQALWAGGKRLGPGQCYLFKIFPVFAEGTYTPGNLHPLMAREHFGWSGSLHKQVASLPDGAAVRIVVGRPVQGPQ